MAARQKGSIEAGFVCSVSGSGVQGGGSVAAAPEKMKRSKASPRKGKEGWLKGVFQRLQWKVRLGGGEHSQGSSGRRPACSGPYAKSGVDTAAQRAPALKWPGNC